MYNDLLSVVRLFRCVTVRLMYCKDLFYFDSSVIFLVIDGLQVPLPLHLVARVLCKSRHFYKTYGATTTRAPVVGKQISGSYPLCFSLGTTFDT